MWQILKEDNSITVVIVDQECSTFSWIVFVDVCLQNKDVVNNFLLDWICYSRQLILGKQIAGHQLSCSLLPYFVLFSYGCILKALTCWCSPKEIAVCSPDNRGFEHSFTAACNSLRWPHFGCLIRPESIN